MLKRKKTKTDDRFFQTFAGEQVKVFTKVNVKESAATQEGVMEINVPLSCSGYLLDYDDNFYYLGDEPNQANTAVRIDQVVMIQEVKNADMYDLLLDQADPRKMN